MIDCICIAGGLPVHVLRPGGVHHEQRDHGPQPRGPGAVEDRLPAQRLRPGLQSLRGRGPRLGRRGDDGLYADPAGRAGGRGPTPSRGGREHQLRTRYSRERDEDLNGPWTSSGWFVRVDDF